MLAGAESDLEPDFRAARLECGRRIARVALREAEARQDLLEQPELPRAWRAASAAPVEPLGRRPETAAR